MNVPFGRRVVMAALDANSGAGGTPASGLRASHDRRGLQTVQPSVRRERGELRARTHQLFGAAPAMFFSVTHVAHIMSPVI